MNTLKSKISLLLADLESTQTIKSNPLGIPHHFFCLDEILLLALSFEIINKLDHEKNISLYIDGFNEYKWTKLYLAYNSKVSLTKFNTKVFTDENLRSIGTQVQFMSKLDLNLGSYSRDVPIDLISNDGAGKSNTIILNFSGLTYNESTLNRITKSSNNNFILENVEFNKYQENTYDYIAPNSAPKRFESEEILTIANLNILIDKNYKRYFE